MASKSTFVLLLEAWSLAQVRDETRRLSMRYISSCYCLLLCEAIYGCRSEEFFCTAEVCGLIARVEFFSFLDKCLLGFLK